MKAALFLTLSLFSAVAFAGPSQAVIDQKGLQVLLSNSAKLADQNGETVASIIARAMVTGKDTHNKTSNSCLYDKNDGLFKCRLIMVNADDQAKDGTESSIEIHYELERGNNGLPSFDVFTMSVESMIAG